MRRGIGGRLVGGIGILVLTVALAPATLAVGSGTPSATLEGVAIPLWSVSSYACHDRDYPVIRCFRSSAAIEGDEAAGATAGGSAPALLSPFVRWYKDANYAGAFFDAYDPYPDLSTIGWGHQISSFKPLNGGHPIWYQGVNYTGAWWDWGTAPEPSLGSANDQFMSVRKG